MVERTIISSFNHYCLIDIKMIEPHIKTGILYASALVNPWSYASGIGAAAIHPYYITVLDFIIKGCKDYGILINPYTVDEPEQIRRLLSAGVDSIITNNVEEAVRINNMLKQEDIK